MDLKKYYRHIREVEAGLGGPFVLVISNETSDGGKAGLISEVPRYVAAKMIVEGRAVLATAEEEETHRSNQLLARKTAEKADLARRLQVAIVTDADLKSNLSKADRNNGGK